MSAALQVKVNEKPILFSGPMVLAILEGRKTQTRRVINPQPLDVITKGANSKSQPTRNLNGYRSWCAKYGNDPATGKMIYCKHGEAGDRLWVRETWCESYYGDPIVYKADGSESPGPKGFWRPSIFMRREHSRLTLEITNIRVERLQEIGEADAQAEGVAPIPCSAASLVFATWKARFRYRDAFSKGWDSINAKRGYSWESNPWVWVIEFKKL